MLARLECHHRVDGVVIASAQETFEIRRKIADPLRDAEGCLIHSKKKSDEQGHQSSKRVRLDTDPSLSPGARCGPEGQDETNVSRMQTLSDKELRASEVLADLASGRATLPGDLREPHRGMHHHRLATTTVRL